MIKRIGWRECCIRIASHKQPLAISKLAEAMKQVYLSEETTTELVKICLQQRNLSAALFHLGFQTRTEIIDSASYLNVSPRENCSIQMENIILPALATCVYSGSKVVFIMNNGDLIRYSFDGTNCIVEKAENITFPSDKRYVVLKGIFDGYDRGPAAIVVGSYNDISVATKAYYNEIKVERAMLATGKYPTDIEYFHDEESLLWVASEMKNGMHWPIIQISVQTVDGTITPFDFDEEEA